MDRYIQKKYFIGQTQPKAWASVYTYKPINPEIRGKRGEIFATINLTGPKDFGLPTAGNLLLDHLHETYFENKNDTALIALEKAVVSTGKHLEKILEHDKAAKTGIDLNLTAMVIINDLVYFVMTGNGHYMLFRDGNLTEIANVLKDPTGEGRVKIGSMVAKRGDVFIVGTPIVTDELSVEELIDVAVNFSDLPLKRKTFEDSGKMGLTLVGFNIDRKEAKEEAEVQKGIIHEQKEEAEEKSEISPELDVVEPTEAADTVSKMVDEAKSTEVATTEITENNEPEVESDKAVVDTGSEIATETFENKEERVFPGVVEGNMEQVESEDLKKPHIRPGGSLDRIGRGGVPERMMPFMEKVKRAGNRVKEKVKEVGARALPILAKTTASLRARLFSRPPEGALSQGEPFAQYPDTTGMQTNPDGSMPGPSAEEGGQEEAAVQAQAQLHNTYRNRSTFAVYFEKIKSRLTAITGGRGVPGQGGDNNRMIFLGVVVVAIILVLFFGIKGVIDRNQQAALETEARGSYEQAVALIDEVDEIAPVVAKSNGASDQTDQLLSKLDEAQNDLDKAKSASSLQDDISSQESKITSLKDLLNHTIAVTDPKVLSDVGGVFPGADISDMAVGNNKVYLSDDQYGKIYQMSTSGTDLRELTSGLENPRSISLDDQGNLLIIDDNQDKKLGLVNVSDGTLTRFAGTSNSKLGTISQIEFSNVNNGNVYAIDQTANEIWRIQRSGSSYGIPQERFKMDELGQATDLAIIDLKIYFLAPVKQGLYRLYSDKDDTPTINGLAPDENLYAATALFIDDENIYIADPDNQRILVFNKDVSEIHLKAQFVYKGSDENALRNIKEMVADRSKGKLWVLDGTKVLELDLSQLTSFT